MQTLASPATYSPNTPRKLRTLCRWGLLLPLLFPLAAQVQLGGGGGGDDDDPPRLPDIVVTAPRLPDVDSMSLDELMEWLLRGLGIWSRGGIIGNPGNTSDVRDASEKDCDEQAGNPIVFATGNKVESSLDFSSSGEMGLYLRRTYNHYWQYPGLLGRHWVTNFDYSLVPQGHSILWAQRPDGRRIKFLLNPTNSRYEEDKAQPGRIVGINGEVTEYRYDARGRLRELRTFRNNGVQSTSYA